MIIELSDAHVEALREILTLDIYEGCEPAVEVLLLDLFDKLGGDPTFDEDTQEQWAVAHEASLKLMKDYCMNDLVLSKKLAKKEKDNEGRFRNN